MDKLFFSEEHVMLVNMITDFAKSEIEPVARELDHESRFPKNIITKMGNLGLMGIPVPEQYGGAGMDTVAYAAAIMELAKVDASVAVSYTHLTLPTNREV